MNKEHIKDSNIAYADLSQGQTEKLKELEKTFNNEFQCEYYLMAMKNHIIKSWQKSGFYLSRSNKSNFTSLNFK